MNGNLPLALNFGGYGADAERGGRGDAGILLARNLLDTDQTRGGGDAGTRGSSSQRLMVARTRRLAGQVPI